MLSAAYLFVASATFVSAAERRAVIIVGASGGEQYAAKYTAWRETLRKALTERLGFGDGVLVLAEVESAGIEKATRENVRRTLGSLRTTLQKDDLLLLVLMGHGTYDGVTAKFNLVGPDLTAGEWGELLKGIAARVVVINTTGASFPFLEELSTRGRVIITATDSPAQRYETVFPQFLVDALGTDAADVDKNGRLSVWEAFSYASQGVKQWYEQKGQLATERPVLDDNGDRNGSEVGQPGPDGALARTTFLDSEAAPVGADATMAGLMKRRQDLVAQIEELKVRRDSMKPEEFEAAFEKLAVELARVSREIRLKS